MRSHDEARALIRARLREHGGQVTRTARALGCSRPFFHWVMRKVGISREPMAIRAELIGRFRLPPLAATRGGEDGAPQ